MAYSQSSSPFLKRGDAPSRKKSLGYYNKAKDSGTPPSKLKPGSKAAKRRKAFCARSKKWKSKRGKAARRRWNC